MEKRVEMILGDVISGDSFEKMITERLADARSGKSDITYAQYFTAEIGKKYFIVSTRKSTSAPNVYSGATVDKVLFNFVDGSSTYSLKALIVTATATKIDMLGNGNICLYAPLD